MFFFSRYDKIRKIKNAFIRIICKWGQFTLFKCRFACFWKWQRSRSHNIDLNLAIFFLSIISIQSLSSSSNKFFGLAYGMIRSRSYKHSSMKRKHFEFYLGFHDSEALYSFIQNREQWKKYPLEKCISNDFRADVIR